jgi:hypothetical protein
MGCSQEIEIDDIENIPPLSEDDKRYADVFRMLDGRWHGRFEILIDENQSYPELVQPRDFDATIFERLSLKEEMIVEVEQIYTSETPYFQRVLIKDTYRDGSGQVRSIESRGVNKIQNGQLWCVVRKPDETVIHSGSLVDNHTIIWQRDLRDPLRIEYFRETVEQNEYAIIGWGYYGDDDPGKSPKYWFRASYKRVREPD